MKNYSRITPEGTRDYLFEECRSRHRIEKKLSDIFSARGFREVVTPGLEYYDVFDPAFSGIGQEVLFKMSDRQGRIVVMRPDNTLPIARLAATRLQNLRKPLRLFYVQPIYRSHPGLAGRSSEDVQAGVELLGAGGFRADLEVLATAVEALNACAPGFRMEIGHAGFFRSLAKSFRLPAISASGSAAPSNPKITARWTSASPALGIPRRFAHFGRFPGFTAGKRCLKRRPRSARGSWRKRSAPCTACTGRSPGSASAAD